MPISLCLVFTSKSKTVVKAACRCGMTLPYDHTRFGVVIREGHLAVSLVLQVIPHMRLPSFSVLSIHLS